MAKVDDFMEDKEFFDLFFESMTKNWEAPLRDKCTHEYISFRKECENFESILKHIVENKELSQIVQNEIKKRLGT